MSDINLRPAQAKLLVDSYRNGGTVYSDRGSQPATARALIRQGLAEPAIGRDYPGGELKALSVWGGQLTERGKLLARSIIASQEN
jgi:hypothetical protein